MHQPSPGARDVSLFLIRVITAMIFFYAGYAKFPLWSADAAATGMEPWLFNLMLFLSIAEPIGAIAMLIGFLTRTAAWCFLIILVGAIYVTQFIMHIGFSTPTSPGWNFPFAMIPACLALIAFGPGGWSVSGMWHRALNRPLGA